MPGVARIAVLISVCAVFGCAPQVAPPRDASTASAHVDASAAWDQMTRVLPGTWRATTPRGSTLDVAFRLVSNGSALVETYGVGGAHETVTVFYRDHADLWLTHYCAQGNEPRLRAVIATPEDVVLRFVDATNVSPDEGVLIERRLRLAAGALDLTETYRVPQGPPDVTTLHFVRAPRFADWAAVRAALVQMYDSDQQDRLELVALEKEAHAQGAAPDPARAEAVRKRVQEQDAKDDADLAAIVRDYGWPPASKVGDLASRGAFLVAQHAPHAEQVAYLAMLRDAVAHGEADAKNLALLEDRVSLAEGGKQLYGSQISTEGGVTLKDVADPEHLDERRARIGLEPICDYLRRFSDRYGPVTWPPCAAGSPAPPLRRKGP